MVVNGGMIKHVPARHCVAGVIAPAPRPTMLGAALMAAFITFPIAVTIFLMDLMML